MFCRRSHARCCSSQSPRQLQHRRQTRLSAQPGQCSHPGALLLSPSQSPSRLSCPACEPAAVCPGQAEHWLTLSLRRQAEASPEITPRPMPQPLPAVSPQLQRQVQSACAAALPLCRLNGVHPSCFAGSRRAREGSRAHTCSPRPAASSSCSHGALDALPQQPGEVRAALMTLSAQVSTAGRLNTSPCAQVEGP